MPTGRSVEGAESQCWHKNVKPTSPPFKTNHRRHQISFGFKFDQALAGVVWPPGLESVIFGFRFSKPLDNVRWPTALRQLSLGESFNLPLHDVRYVTCSMLGKSGGRRPSLRYSSSTYT